MEGWIWCLAGLGLFAAELFTPGGFFLLFFGMGALVVGALRLIGLDVSLGAQSAIFATVSVALLLLFRRALIERFGTHGDKVPAPGLVGSRAEAEAEIGPGALGKVQLHGTQWSARNEGEAPIAAGAPCTVTALEGIALVVRAL
jgi:membrane protein implicated in regulation of membrane protease activity